MAINPFIIRITPREASIVTHVPGSDIGRYKVTCSIFSKVDRFFFSLTSWYYSKHLPLAACTIETNKITQN